jgi:hypothetical protein
MEPAPYPALASVCTLCTVYTGTVLMGLTVLIEPGTEPGKEPGMEPKVLSSEKENFQHRYL